MLVRIVLLFLIAMVALAWLGGWRVKSGKTRKKPRR